jgi:predicted NBD/HSP70 family sugar kinase
MARSDLKSLLVEGTGGTPESRIVRALSEGGAMSAAQIARLTGLAKSTVSTALSELRGSGMVVESHEAAGGREASVGRPATVLTLNPQAGTCVGILIGLEHIQVIVADVSHAVLFDESIEMQIDYTQDEATGLVRALVQKAYAGAGISMDTLLGVGIGVGSPIDPNSGRVMRAGGVNTWAGIDIRTIFEPALEQAIFADNESNCAAIAEMMWGAARGHEDFVLFTVDLGVGGAIVSHGHVLRGAAGGAGEFGHISLDPNGPLCRCGNRGCIELYASFREPLQLAARRFGRPMSFEEVIQLALDGDPGCRRLIEDNAEIAGRALGIVGSAINPGLIIVTGRPVRAGNMFMEPLTRAFEKHTLIKRQDVSEEARTRIVPGSFINNGACMGAVGLVLRHHGRLH